MLMTGPWLGVTALAQVEDFPRKGPFRFLFFGNVPVYMKYHK